MIANDVHWQKEKKNLLSKISSQSADFSSKPMTLLSTIKLFQWMVGLYGPS